MQKPRRRGGRENIIQGGPLDSGSVNGLLIQITSFTHFSKSSTLLHHPEEEDN